MPVGRKPKDPGQRRNRHPLKYAQQEAPASGWRHGPVPDPPEGLTPASEEAWRLWFGAWWAGFYEVADVPLLRLIIGLFDVVERNPDNVKVAAELRLWLDRYGITPKGRQDLRWQPPKAEARSTPDPSSVRVLRVVDPQDKETPSA